MLLFRGVKALRVKRPVGFPGEKNTNLWEYNPGCWKMTANPQDQQLSQQNSYLNTFYIT